VPELEGTGATAAVLGAYIVLCSASRVLTRIFPVFLVRIPGWIFVGSAGARWPSTAASSWLHRKHDVGDEMPIGLVSGIVNTDMSNQY
jgi:hypothetical protein